METWKKVVLFLGTISFLLSSLGVLGENYCAGTCKTFVCPSCCGKSAKECHDCLETCQPACNWIQLDLCNSQSWSDPLLPMQWQLENINQFGMSGVDIAISAAWSNGYFGEGVVVAVLDETINTDHPDLQNKHQSLLSIDYSAGKHATLGTLKASVAVGEGNNHVCGVGVAPKSQLATITFPFAELANPFSTTVQSALSHHYGLNDIYVGFRHRHQTLENFEDSIAVSSIQLGAQDGRGGKGNIYVWPSGDDGEMGYDCNMNSFANSPYTLTVGAIDSQGLVTPFSQGGSSLLVVAPGARITGAGGEGEACEFEGDSTELAASVIAGMAAIVLEARPELHWNDVMQIFIESAHAPPVSSGDNGWVRNGAGRRVHYRYGFGLPTMTDVLETTAGWEPRGKVHVWTAVDNYDFEIPDDGSLTFTKTLKFIPQTCKILYTEVSFFLTHGNPGDLKISLTSPEGTESHLLSPRGIYSLDQDEKEEENKGLKMIELSLKTSSNIDETLRGIESKKGTTFDELITKYPAVKVVSSSQSCCTSDQCEPDLIPRNSRLIVLLPKKNECPIRTRLAHVAARGYVGVLIPLSDSELEVFTRDKTPFGIAIAAVRDSHYSTVYQQLGAQNSAQITSSTTLAQKLIAPSFSGRNFTTARNYGEKCSGNWQITIEDTASFHSGNLEKMELRIYHSGPALEPTPTPSPTPPPVPTPTPKRTPTPPPVPTPTYQPGPSPTPTPTLPPVPTPSPTPTPTIPPSPTPTPTEPTPSPIPSPTPVPPPDSSAFGYITNHPVFAVSGLFLIAILTTAILHFTLRGSEEVELERRGRRRRKKKDEEEERDASVPVLSEEN